MFDLEKAITIWKKSLRKNSALEDGYIEELESHLRDSIENYVKSGQSEGEAFDLAVSRIGGAETIGGDFKKSTSLIYRKNSIIKQIFIPILFLSYLKLTIRNFLKHKGYSFLNTSGLIIGMTVFFLVIQYISFEKNYDSFHENYDRIYRIRNDRIYSDKHDKSAGCPPALAPTLRKEFPEVLESARVRGIDIMYLDKTKGITENIGKVYHADSSFLSIFTFPLLQGDFKSALVEPYSVVFSKSLSQKYFGSENPVGKTITLVDKYGNNYYRITGVFEDVPQNSHIKFNMLISFSTLVSENSRVQHTWGWNAFNTYILLKPNADPRELEAKFPAMVEKYKNYESSYKRVYHLQPLKDIHLYSHLRFEPEVNGDASSVDFLSIIAVFVLVLAWVNYINLSTCRSITRAKEVGIRKVLGSDRLQLIKQFMTESFAMNILAVLFALGITSVVLPYFSSLTGKLLTMELPYNHWITITLILITGTFMSGIYPAFVLSSFKPAAVFKSKLGKGSHNFNLRKGLVVFQFSISIILIAATITVYKQVEFMRNKDPGVNIDQTLVVNAPISGDRSIATATSLKSELMNLAGIKGVCASASVPGKGYSNASSGVRKFSSNPEDGTQGFFIGADENYFSLFNVQLLAGRYFTSQSSFNREIIINEEAVKVYGFENPEDAVNHKLIFDGFDGQSIEIVGVAKNFHQESLRSSILPIVFNPVKDGDYSRARYFSIKLDSQNISRLLSQIKSKWEEIYPDRPFEYEFLDKVFDSQYKADLEFGKVIGLFSFLAIIISCLGALGLAVFANVQRTKEIGIRKVIGASVKDIFIMLVKDFTKWVLFANLIAWPLTFVIMNKWLTNFAYHITLDWWIFVISGVFALMIALFTIGWHALRTAVANPVNSLKYE